MQLLQLNFLKLSSPLHLQKPAVLLQRNEVFQVSGLVPSTSLTFRVFAEVQVQKSAVYTQHAVYTDKDEILDLKC